jgi:hypothetical protein
MMAFTLQAQQVIQVQSIDRFDKIVDATSLAVVYLYELKPGTEEGDRYTTIDDNHTVLRLLSRNYRYSRARVEFISANLQRDDLDQLKKRYGITKPDTLLLLRNGKQYKNARLTGTFKREEVRKLIDDNFGDFIDDKLAEREEARRRYEAQQPRREKTTYVTYAPYWGPAYGYPGYAYPYYGYYRGGFGYYRPGGFGFGFGF